MIILAFEFPDSKSFLPFKTKLNPAIFAGHFEGDVVYSNRLLLSHLEV